MNNVIEAQCLNYVLKKGNLSFITYNNLDETYFPTFNQEYRFIVDHFNKYGNVPDKATMVGEFPQFEFLDVGESDTYLVKEIKELHLYRKLVPDVNKIVSLMSAGKTDEAIVYLTTTASKIPPIRDTEPTRLIKQYEKRLETFEEKCKNIDVAYTTTGLPELDEIIGGWDRKEEFAIVAAKTNVGKSWFALFFALQAAKKGLRVGIYSGEMESDKVGYRVDSFLFNISNYGLTHGDSRIIEEYREALKRISDEVAGEMVVYTPNDLDGYPTATKLKSCIERDELDMLIIDQISLMEDEKKARNKTDRFANIASALKNLQTATHKPIIAVAQLNREKTDDGSVTIDNIAEAYDIMRFATIGLLIEQKDSEETKLKRVVLTIGKARDSDKGKKLTYMWDINYGKLTYVPTENDATKGKHIEELKETFGDIEENIF